MKIFVTDDGKYRIESLTAATIPGALNVMKEALFKDENVSIGSEVNKNPEAIEELLEVCADAALDGVSLVAVAVNTGEVAAAVFNKIKMKSSDESETAFIDIFIKERCMHPSARSLIQFMADVEGRCNLFELYDIDCCFDLMFLGTLREHRRRKLGMLLCKYSVEIAWNVKHGSIVPISVTDLGPKYFHLKNRKPINTYPKICQAMCTVKGSQEIMKQLNFKVHLTVSHSEFEFNGKTYTERIGDESAVCQVMSLHLFGVK